MVSWRPISECVSPPLTMPPIHCVGSTITTEAPSRAAATAAMMPPGVPP
jgi:hypothetical protein